MTWREKIIKAHTDVTDAVSHYARMKSDRYFVWQEDGANDFIADGQHVSRAMSGSTDLYTKQNNDPWIAAFERSLGENSIAWELNSVQYEEDTGYIHYEWVWEVTDDGEADI